MANGAIKGITVEIGGDTTKLGKALGDTEKKSRSLQVELRQIEKLLKFDPTNTELLAQKQEVLSASIGETAKKLDTLKEAEKQVIAQFRRGEIAEEQLRALQREIISTEKDLNGMRTELKSTRKNMTQLATGTNTAEKETEEYKKAVADAKEELSGFKDKASEAFETLKTGATVLGGAVVATGGYALNLSTNFDKAFNTLITKTGASEREMQYFESAMENVYANNFGESIEDVANSMATVHTNMGVTGSAIEGVTQNAILLRDTFEFDVNESTRSAKMLMDQYGMSADDAFNLIVQGAQNGLDKNGDLLDTINEYGVHFAGMGLSAEDMFNMLANGADSGTFSVDKLGDSVKEFGIRVKDGTADDAFKTLGFNAGEMKKKFAEGGDGAKESLQAVTKALFNMEDPVKQNQLGVELFGTMWEDLGADGVKALMNLDGGISTTKDALGTINDQKYDDIGSALSGLGRTLETEVALPLGEKLKPIVESIIGFLQENSESITSFLNSVVDGVGKFVGFLVDHGDVVLSVIAGIGAGLLLWNVVSMITGVVNAIKAFKTANEAATVAQALLNAVMNANPIGILITVIGAVVVAIVTFIATNDNARAKFIEIWNKIKSACSTAINAIVNFFTVTIPTAWNNFLAWLPTFINGIVTWFSQLPGKIQVWLTNVVNKITAWGASIKEKATNAVNSLVSKVVSFFSSMASKIGTWLTNIVTKITTWGTNIKTKATTAVSSLVSTVVTWFQGLPGKIQTWLNNVVTRITSWGTQIKNKAVTAVTALVTGAINLFKTLPTKIWSAIVGAVTKVTTWGTQIKTKAVTAVTNLVTGVYNLAKQIPNKIYVAIFGALAKVVSWGQSMVTKAKTAMTNVGTAIKTGLAGVPGSVLTIGSNIVQGLWNGISNMTSWIGEKIKGFGDSVLSGLKSFFGIESPSTVMRDQVGKFLSEGIAVGITANADEPLEAMETLGNELTNTEMDFNGATINRKLTTTFAGNNATANSNQALLSKLDGIYERLSRLQIVLDTGTLVGETIDKIDAGLGSKQLLSARGV